MENTKDITGNDAYGIILAMEHFQNVHNELRKDFLSIYNITVATAIESELHSPLVRSCIKELFTLIEADVYLYNQYNPYTDFDETGSILDKFKKTFKHHGKEFKKLDTVIAFYSRWFQYMKRVKLLRDRITHPKGKSSIKVSQDDLKLTFSVYEAYTNFVNEVMTGTALSIKLSTESLLTDSNRDS